MQNIPYCLFTSDLPRPPAAAAAAAAAGKADKSSSSTDVIARAKPAHVNLSNVELALLSKLVQIYGLNDANTLASLLGTRTPDEISQLIEQAQSEGDQGEYHQLLEGAMNSNANATVKKNAKQRRGSHAPTFARKSGARKEYQPCSHEGACTSSTCLCLQNGGFCEKFCACGVDCRHRFQVPLYCSWRIIESDAFSIS
jgi:hypothetical protein